MVQEEQVRMVVVRKGAPGRAESHRAAAQGAAVEKARAAQKEWPAPQTRVKARPRFLWVSISVAAMRIVWGATVPGLNYQAAAVLAAQRSKHARMMSPVVWA
jgi:hypothetical protein